ncbi:alpha/beta hydrolase family esterase [Hyphomonas sp.]|uniref:alpha/beta hydrolase family esterase n=1 Tax=Hyphomonas sp. TaxID=87 RepID=UPI003918E442
MRAFFALFLTASLFFSPAATASPGRAAEGETLTVGTGQSAREFMLFRPAGTSGPVPLVMVFHGGGGGDDWMAGRSRELNRTLTNAGYAVAYMNGSARHRREKLRTWNAIHCCAYAARQRINEAAFADAAVDLLDQRIGIDRTRIFLTGHSNGAMLSYRLAGQMKTTPRAIAPVSGAIFADQPAIPARTSIFMYHAKNDDVLSFDGNPDDKAERWRTAPHLGFVDAEARLAELKSCGRASPAGGPAGLATTTRTCTGGSVLIATAAETGGHEWPARPQADYRIEDALLEFFNSQR